MRCCTTHRLPFRLFFREGWFPRFELKITVRGRCAFLAILAAAILFSASSPAAGDNSLVADSVVGKVEVQRAGRKNWKLIDAGNRLYNNDVIRVLDKSHARLAWPDGSVMYVNRNSQMLINLHGAKAETGDASTKHVTVFFGAVFFLVKKIMPRPLTDAHDTKICTPTSVVSIRGTSFETAVNGSTGATDIRIINGTVLARNILKNVSLFLGAGNKTTITMNTDPILPSPLLKTDIDNLKKWVPWKVIDEEMKKQTAKARRDHFIITGKFEDRILVLPFSNSSTYQGTWNIGSAVGATLCRGMKKEYRNLKMTYKDTLGADPMVLGAKENSRYVIVGTIDQFDIIQHARISAKADEYKEFNTARVRITINLIDVSQKKLIYDNTFEAEVSARNTAETTWHAIRKMRFDLTDKKFAGSILGQALTQTLETCRSKIGDYVHTF